MLRLFVFVAIATLVSAQNATRSSGSNPDTRLFGLGNVINGAIGAVGGAIAGGLNGGLQGANPGFQQGGFQPGFNRPQQGFNIQQQGFNRPQQGFNRPQQAFQQQQLLQQQQQQQALQQQLLQQQQGFNQFQQPGFNSFQQQQGFPGQGFQGFPGQGFPGQGIPTGNIPVGSAIVNPGFSDNRPVVQGVTNSCRRWCKTPQGQAFCCEGGNEAQQVAATKGGLCPPVRPACPPTRGFAPPRTCSSDGACAGVDKCCFDVCLQDTTCKPPQGVGK